MTRKVKHNQITCRCPAYPFPHRQGSGKCTMPNYCAALHDDDWESCGYCRMDDRCPYQDHLRYYTNHKENHPSLTIQERNLNFRSW